MSNTYQFTIKALKTYPQYKGKANVVSAIEWAYSTTQNGKTATIENVKPLNLDDLDNFVDFASLTEAQALTWLEASFTEYGLSEMQKNLDAQLAGDALVETNSALPWA